MAYEYNVRGVDFSGLAQGISQGIMQAAQIRRQQDLLVEKELDDFEKKYDPDKLRTNEIPDFTSAFSDYKDIALKYSKLNRGRGTTEELAVAGALKTAALKKMNSIYTGSVSASNLLVERKTYRDQLFKQGYAIPDEVNKEIMSLSSTPLSEMKLDSFVSPYSREVYANPTDLNFLYKANNLVKIDKYDVEDESKSQEISIEGFGKVKLPYMNKVHMPDMLAMLNTTRNSIAAKPALGNTAKRDYEKFILDYDNKAPEALAKAKKIRTILGEDVVFAPDIILMSNSPAFDAKTESIGLNDDHYKSVLKLMGQKLSGKRLSIATQSLNLQLAKFGYKKKEDQLGVILKPGSELTEQGKDAFKAQKADPEAVRAAQLKAALDNKKKGGLDNPFNKGAELPPKSGN
jgi:hypothetical protein